MTTPRSVPVSAITAIVAELVQTANFDLPPEVVQRVESALAEESSPTGQFVLRQILDNAELAARERVPLCQDTGVTVVFLEIGQDVHLTGGTLAEAVNEGVRQGYAAGFLRNSVVAAPLGAQRLNTGDNTPAVLHTELVPGDKVRVVVMPKGGGCENMSYLSMLPPAAGTDGVVDFVVESVVRSGGNPCPPLIVGVGIGGTADKAMSMAKRALIRKVGEPHADPEVAALEARLLQEINASGVGPMGFGGRTTALAVHVETFACHIASLPVAVNLQCHSARWQEAWI